MDESKESLEISELKVAFSNASDDARAEKMKAYMRGHFIFFGVMAGPRKEISKAFIKSWKKMDWSESWIILEELWNCDERELQYVAIDLLSSLKKMPEDSIDRLEYLIQTKSWWDSVDGLASNSVGQYFKLFPDRRRSIIDRWLDSGNIWLMRSAIIHQLKYKRNVDWSLLRHCIESTTGTKEFFLNKAHGWALREYSKVEPERVEQYIRSNAKLSPLAIREGLKAIER